MRHILSMSGGKDSTALALYMKDKVQGMEYIFSDTGKELPETYEYLDAIEAFLGKMIYRLNASQSFDHHLKMHGGLLPSSHVRWCTRALKIEPFENFVGDDEVTNYIGIRADEEHRVGYQPLNIKKHKIHPKYPFIEDGIEKADVLRILEESCLGLPEYYKWRTRSGCYFCFFQRKAEWVGLLENHPELYQLAKGYECETPTGKLWTWRRGESLEELEQPHRVKEVKDSLAAAVPDAIQTEMFEQYLDDEDDDTPCIECHL